MDPATSLIELDLLAALLALGAMAALAALTALAELAELRSSFCIDSRLRITLWPDRYFCYVRSNG
jgi:hypothetical protein